MAADLTNRIVAQGCVLARAIEPLGTIETTGPSAPSRCRWAQGIILDSVQKKRGTLLESSHSPERRNPDEG